jgi:regulator of nonsense transcripts 3
VKQEDIFIFKDKFDGYVFVDLKGNEYPAIVEFAPFQKIPRRRFSADKQSSKTKDTKAGTIEQDPDYLKFLTALEEGKNEANLPSAEVYLEEMEAKDKELRANHGCPKVTTPLIEFVLNRMKEREERRDERRNLHIESRRARDGDANRRRDGGNRGAEAKTSNDKPDKKVQGRRDRQRNKKDKNLDEKKASNDHSMRFGSKDKEPFAPKVLQNEQVVVKRDESKITGATSDTKAKDANEAKEFKEPKPYRERQKKNDQKPPVDRRDSGASRREKANQGSDVKKPNEPKPERNRDTENGDRKVEKPVRKDDKRERRDDRPEKRNDRETPEKGDERDKPERSGERSKGRLKNKDRPAQEIYRPGSKPTTASATGESSEVRPEVNEKVKSKVFVSKNRQ